jgi:WhiB family redox-sensing transcriptional regulator
MLPNDRDFSWLQQAPCKDAPLDVFFPPRDKELYRKLADEAKTYCYGGKGRPECPVRQRCLWQAINTDEQHGIWGGCLIEKETLWYASGRETINTK